MTLAIWVVSTAVVSTFVTGVAYWYLLVAPKTRELGALETENAALKAKKPLEPKPPSPTSAKAKPLSERVLWSIGDAVYFPMGENAKVQGKIVDFDQDDRYDDKALVRIDGAPDEDSKKKRNVWRLGLDEIERVP